MLFSIALLAVGVGTLTGGVSHIHADEDTCGASSDSSCANTGDTKTCAADEDELIEKTTNCVANSESYIACVAAANDESGTANCACLGQAPDIASCLGNCFERAKDGLCAGADEATLAAAAAKGGRAGDAEEATAENPGKEEECDLAAASELLQSCMPNDVAVLQCLQSGLGQCECFQKASVLVECLGSCFVPVVNGVCPKEKSAGNSPAKAGEGAAEEEDANMPCDDTDAAERLKACATKDTEFENCMFADESGEGECSCLYQSAETLKCFGRCKEEILEGLQCPPQDDLQPAAPACSAKDASAKLVACAKQDIQFVRCLQDGGEECGCIAAASDLTGCLGNCATIIAGKLGCSGSGKAAGTAAATGSETEDDPDGSASCDAETAEAKLKVCAREDAEYADCMLRNEDNACFCLPNHPPTHACMGECLGTMINDVLGCDWSAEADAVPTCDKDAAKAKFEECSALDPILVACLKSNMLTKCDCISGSEITMDCLQNCLDPLNEVLDCPLFGSPPAPPSVASHACDGGGCCEVDAAPKLQECATRDAAMVACLQQGTPACECLSNSEMTQDCLGHCLDTINAVLGCLEHGSDRPRVPRSVGCTAEYAAKQLKTCASEDPLVLDCFRSGVDAGKAGYQCGCLQASAHIQVCLGGCAALIGKSMDGCVLEEDLVKQHNLLQEAKEKAATSNPGAVQVGQGNCDTSKIGENLKRCVETAAAQPRSSLVKCLRDNPNSKGTECKCMDESQFVQACLGPACWPEVRKSICEDTQANQGATHGGEPRSCDSAKATALTTMCISKDASVLECLQNGGDKCYCVQQSASATLKPCLGVCWGKVTQALCGANDATSSAVATGAAAGGGSVSGGSTGGGGRKSPADYRSEVVPSSSSASSTGVEQLLDSIGLAKLWPTLHAEDVTDLATLADLTRDDFKGMGITVGKASKIMRAAKKATL